MRITGGELRGRILKVPAAGHVRPTQDAVREALFSILMAEVPGSRFLDLYAGSGAVGIEAWSRGAAHVTWVESHPGVARVLAANVETLCGGAGTIVREDALRWIARPHPGEEPYGVVFADPPYGDTDHEDPIEALMGALARSPLVAEGTVFVAEQRAGLPMPKAPGWARIKDRRYGHTRLAIFVRNPSPAPAADAVTKIPGVVVRGHGVASGKAGDPRFPDGTLTLQAPHFKALGLDLSEFHIGTINVDCAPLRFEPGPDAILFEHVKWHPDVQAETFSFARVAIIHHGVRYPALIYFPHPETKPEHFQPGGVAEIIAPRIEGLAYGDAVTLESTPDQALWAPIGSPSEHLTSP